MLGFETLRSAPGLLEILLKWTGPSLAVEGFE